MTLSVLQTATAVKSDKAYGLHYHSLESAANTSAVLITSMCIWSQLLDYTTSLQCDWWQCGGYLEDFRVRDHGRVGACNVQIALVELPEASFGHLGLISPIHLGYVVPLHVADGMLCHVPRKGYCQVIPVPLHQQDILFSDGNHSMSCSAVTAVMQQ